MAGPPGAGLLVCGVRRVAALVTHRCGDASRRLPERALRPPETAERELGDLRALGIRRPQRRAEHLVPGGYPPRGGPPPQCPLPGDPPRPGRGEYAHPVLPLGPPRSKRLRP